jgi:hypothetical protein
VAIVELQTDTPATIETATPALEEQEDKEPAQSDDGPAITTPKPEDVVAESGGVIRSKKIEYEVDVTTATLFKRWMGTCVFKSAMWLIEGSKV